MMPEVCTFAHEGREFTANGAHITDDRLVAYLGSQGNAVTTWHGEIIGRYTITKHWRVATRYGGVYDMNQVYIVLNDGRRYQGRSQGPSMIVTARRVVDRRVAK